ncbi:DUF1272 domain-containing protein [Candidatus Sumerlaeota bacterium]|nr:DUF1272 domain-containing protein [Candidatus Sumerlaeota bacterium]
MLKMKEHCEKCGAATAPTGAAYICSYECTFCESCTNEMKSVCPNCGGNLVLRPTRTKGPVAAVVTRVSNKLRGK